MNPHYDLVRKTCTDEGIAEDVADKIAAKLAPVLDGLAAARDSAANDYNNLVAARAQG